MNPFMRSEGAYVDKKVVEYFLRIQKKTVAAREKTMSKMLSEISILDPVSIERCLFDVLPVLCKELSQELQEILEQIMLFLLEKDCFSLMEERLYLWLSHFLCRPDREGRRLLSCLAKKKKLANILMQYKRACSVLEHMQCTILEIHYSIPFELDITIAERIDLQSQKQLQVLVTLVERAKKANAFFPVLEKTAQKIASRMEEISKAEIAPYKWQLFLLLQHPYSALLLEEESIYIPADTFSALLSSSYFTEIVPKSDIPLFVQRCKVLLPAVLDHPSLTLYTDRKILLEKIISSNNIDTLRNLAIHVDDFPFLNTLHETEKVSAIVQQHKSSSWINTPTIYEELSDVEIIARADALNAKIEEVAPLLLQRITLQELRDYGILLQAVRVFPAAYFEKVADKLKPEEEIYVVSMFPSLCNEHTIDLLFDYSLFPEELLLSLSSDLYKYLAQSLSQQSLDVAKAVYEVVKSKIAGDTEFFFFSVLYKDPLYADKQFGMQYKIPKEENIDIKYLIYLAERNALDADSLYAYVLEEIGKNPSGSLNIESNWLLIQELLDKEVISPEASISSFVFEDAEKKYRKILTVLERNGCGEAGLLHKILAIENKLPDFSILSNLSNENDIDISIFWRDRGEAGRIFRAMYFEKEAKSGVYPSILQKVEANYPNICSSSLYTFYLTTVIDGYTVTTNYDIMAEIDSIVSLMDRLNGEEKEFGVYIALKLCTRVSFHADNVSILWKSISKYLPAAHPRIVSYALQHLPKHTVREIIYSVPYSSVSTCTLRHIQDILAECPEKASVSIKSDNCWTYKKSSKSERVAVYTPALASISQHYSNNAFNMYSMAQVEKDAISSEVFYLMFDIPAINDIKSMDAYEWRIFLLICNQIRSIEICALLSTMVRAECRWINLLITCEAVNMPFLGLFARTFPALMRIFHQSSKRKQQLTNYFVQSVAPDIIQEEAGRPLQGILLRLKTVASTHIVMVTYRIEDSSIEVHLRFPASYPLAPPETQIVSCVGIRQQKLRRLILRVQMLLSEFCRIGEALALWKVVLDQSVNDEEECGICFFLLDEITRRFPEAECPSCSNKFHQSCLRQWMRKSKNLCPVCRMKISSVSGDH